MTTLGEAATITRRTPSPRTLRKARKRETERARQKTREADIAVLSAHRAEATAEEQAPAAQRTNGYAEPDTKRGGFRRINPLILMNRASHGRTITADHLKAQRRLRDDYELGVVRASAGKSSVERVDSGAGDGAEFAWLAATERYRAAMAALSPSVRGMVEAIAIHDWAAPKIAAAIDQSDVSAVGLIMAGMDQLADHYNPGRQTRATAMEQALAGQRPLGYDFAISAIGEAIPQERLGRGRIRA